MPISRFVSRYLDLLSEPLFASHPGEAETFHPIGLFSRGYIVPDADTGARLRYAVKWAYAFMFIVIGLLAAPLGALLGTGLGALVLIAIVLPLLFGRLTWLARGLSPSERRLTLGAANDAQSEKLSFRALWLNAFLGAGMAAMAAWAAAADAELPQVDPTMWWLLIGSSVFFAGCTLSVLVSIVRKRRKLARAGAA